MADAGPLIGLARIGRLDLLTVVFEEVLVPETVKVECCQDIGLPGARAIRIALDQALGVSQVADEPSALVLPVALGSGERAVIELAQRRGLGALLDDGLARRVARRAGLAVLGTGGLLLLAKQHGTLQKIGPLLRDLTREGYRLAPALVDDLLRRAGER